VRDVHPAFRAPQPKGFRCPACTHLTFVHREHGCDSEGCDCGAPHGRIMPADEAPDPSLVLVVDRAEARERLARHLYIAARSRTDEDRVFAASLWESDTAAGLREEWRRRADAAIAAIAAIADKEN
jgi:hypothetical protein